MSEALIQQLRDDMDRSHRRMLAARTELSLAQTEFELARDNLENALLYKKGYLTDV